MNIRGSNTEKGDLCLTLPIFPHFLVQISFTFYFTLKKIRTM